MRLVFASSNKNKIREINALMPEGFTVVGLEEIGITEEIPENGTTIKENSLLKAKYVVNVLKGKENVAVFADDSGLEVNALDMAPGVYSARYAGIPKSDTANNLKLLEALSRVTDRKSRFITILTLIIKDTVYYFEGEIQGTIAHEPRGTNGFGYDPLFIPRGSRSTFAELSAADKNAISHRALAVKQLVTFLNNYKQK